MEEERRKGRKEGRQAGKLDGLGRTSSSYQA